MNIVDAAPFGANKDVISKKENDHSKIHRTELIVKIANHVISTNIGVYDEERAKPQRLIVSVTLKINQDKMKGDYFDYDPIVHFMNGSIAKRRHLTQEGLAEEIAHFCFSFEEVSELEIETSKPDIHSNTGGVGINCKYRR